MWPWIKRWRDWAMNELWPMYRLRPQPQALHYGYEKAGLIIHDQPIPWNAEAVLVEAALRLPSAAARRKSDYQLRLPFQDALPAEYLRRHDGDGFYHVSFRLSSPPPTTVTAELLYRGQVLGQLTLPRLGKDEFLEGLRLQMPTLYVRLGQDTVACQTFVSTQCKGLIASALLVSPTSLAPLIDLDLQVEFRSERTGSTQQMPIRLCSSQLRGNTALVTVVPRRFPKRVGDWVVTWYAGDQLLVCQKARGISQRTFQRSLRVADTRFVIQTAKGSVKLARQFVIADLAERVGPCFLLSSREPGMAGLCSIQVHAQMSGGDQPPMLLEQEVLITDGPTMVAPGTVNAADLSQVTAFELCIKNHTLGLMPLCPTPTATFTNEGGFKPPSNFLWSSAADEELNERLNRLIEGRSAGE
ncbi:MAG: hypothetical protein ACJ8FY_16115 [Gemmataceae bacterium]